MIATERIGQVGAGREFTIVHGALKDGVKYHAVGVHEHFGGDTTSTVNGMLRAAVRAGLDRITVTDHDTTRRHARVKHLIDKHGYPLVMEPGIEVTARNESFQPRHILVYGAKEAPPPGLSMEEVNRWAHELPGNVRTTVAHPELADFSANRAELASVQNNPDPNARFDWGEMANGASMQVDRLREEHPRLTSLGIVDNFLPQADANATMMEVLTPYANSIVFVGGADGHEGDGVASVVNLVPEKMGFIEAVDAGEHVIIKKTQSPGLPLWRIGLAVMRHVPLIVQESRARRQWARTRSQSLMV